MWGPLDHRHVYSQNSKSKSARSLPRAARARSVRHLAALPCYVARAITTRPQHVLLTMRGIIKLAMPKKEAFKRHRLTLTSIASPGFNGIDGGFMLYIFI